MLSCSGEYGEDELKDAVVKQEDEVDDEFDSGGEE